MQARRTHAPLLPPGKDRLGTLDLLRLLAALSVVLFHYLFRGAAADGYLATGYPEAAPYAIYGYFGLNLFFMISGFVIAWSAEGRGAPAFAVARFARLYPGFIACMTVTFAVTVLFGMPPFSATWEQYGANLTMFAPALGQPFMDGVYWTIVLEIVFYGWVALALLAGIFERWKLQLVAAWLALAMLNEYALDNGALRLVLVTEYAPCFAIGIMMHHVGAHGRSVEALLLTATAAVMSFSATIPLRDWMVDHYGIGLFDTALFAANATIIVLFAAAVGARRLVPGSALVLLLGGMTYPLYLLHQHIGYIALNLLVPELGSWSAFALVLAAMLALSAIIWALVERPVQHLIKRALMPVADRFDRRRLNIVAMKKGA
jgi:peptidoglycan/LPS O-acetylase OafA/YrhL